MDDITLKLLIDSKTLYPPLSPDNSVDDALNQMTKHEISSVVIADSDQKPVGIFTEHDSLRVLANSIPKQTRLEEVMTPDLFMVKDSLYLHDAYTLLEQHGYRHLIVVDDDAKLVGVVTEGDFIREMGFEHIAKIQRVEDAMGKTPLVIKPGTPITVAAEKMRKHHCDYAIICEDKKPTGIIQERMITHFCAQHAQDTVVAVEEIASKQLHLIKHNTPLQEAAKTIEEHGVHQLIVTLDDGEVIGILNRHDVLKSVHGAYYDFLLKTIRQKNNLVDHLSDNAHYLTQHTSMLETVINTIPDLVWVKDPDGVYITCNSAFERFFGAKRDTIKGKTDFDFVDSELAQFFRDHDQMALKADTSLSNEEYLVFADGSYEGEFETIKTPMRDANGRLIGVVGIARDITERIKNAEELRQKDQELDEAQTFAHVGSWSYDIATSTFSASEEVKRIYGVTDQDTNYETFMTTIHPDDKKLVEEKFNKALQSGEYLITHRILINDETRWIYATAKGVWDQDGKIVELQGVLQDITQMKMYEEKLEELVNYDRLTGLANRTLLLSYLEKSLQKAKRNKSRLGFILFDLDRFKNINDSFGHQAGDELLVMASKRIVERIRQENLVARLGGDEFAIILEDLRREEDTGHIAQDLIDLLSESFTLSDGTQVHIGASAGIVMAPTHGESVQELLQYADTALYKAKNEGRNTFCYYSDELTQSAKERIEYENRLRQALENSEFELYYQPQVHIETGRIVGAEALIRWNHPEKGLIPPNLFIPIAEETGLIVPIGQWVIEEACRQGMAWNMMGHHLHISVNVSAHQLRHQNLPSIVEAAIRQSGFKADKLTIELTESAMMEREEELAQMLHSLRAIGAYLAIDDFGTGYSSYSYLKRFPINILKIDKSFIDDVPYENDDTAIVKAIIAMGKALGYQILAEGTEHQEQIDFLQSVKCDLYQGYYKSPPLQADDFERLL